MSELSVVRTEKKYNISPCQRSTLLYRLEPIMQLDQHSGLVELGSDTAMMFYRILETGLYRPQCIIEYNRIAFAEESNDIRITVDSDIGMNPFCERFFDRGVSYLPVRKEPVLEVKYNRFLLSSFKQVLDFADSTELAISKYAMSRQVLGM